MDFFIYIITNSNQINKLPNYLRFYPNFIYHIYIFLLYYLIYTKYINHILKMLENIM